MTITHNFELSDEQSMIRDTVAGFVESDAAPKALHHDEHGEFVRENFTKLAELGLLGLPIAEASGGAGLGMLTFAVALEALAKGCGSTARLLLSQAGLCGKALEGLESARATLDEITAGSRLAAYVGPEFGIQAEIQGGGCTLSGRAALVSAGAVAETLVVVASTAAGKVLCLVPGAAAQRTALHALGFRASAPAAVVFTKTPATTVATGVDADAAIARAQLAAMIGGAAIAVGTAFASIDATRRHAGERIAFGKPLLAQPAVAHKLAEMRRKAESARHLTYHAARIADAGADAGLPAMLAKLEACEAAVLAGDEGIQVHGGYGYVVEYHVERHYRDAKTLEVLDLGAETLRDRVAAAIR